MAAANVIQDIIATNALTEGYLPEDTDLPTIAIHAGYSPDKCSPKPIVSPISVSSSYQQRCESDEDAEQYVYSRIDNPTRKVLETCLASLEGGKYGLTFASGLGVTNAITQLLSLSDHVICSYHIYGGTYQYFNEIARKSGIRVSFFDFNDITNLDKEIKSNTKLIWLENPTNPMMNVIDIGKISQYVKSKNSNIIIVVDNTYSTPYFQKPLTLGADISMHSLSKYINGHTDVVMGAAITNNETIYANLKLIQKAAGAVPSPFDCYLVNRGLKTLPLRMKQHMQNGLIVARYLENHPLVLKVLHPGLESHPDHKLAKRQWSGCSGMLAFYIKGDIDDAKLFMRKLKYFVHSASLGGFESMISIPSLISHKSVPIAEREKLGIHDNLIRVSVGLESPNHLVKDLQQALLAVEAAKK